MDKLDIGKYEVDSTDKDEKYNKTNDETYFPSVDSYKDGSILNVDHLQKGSFQFNSERDDDFSQNSCNKVPGSVQTDKDSIETDFIQEETVADETSYCDHNADHMAFIGLVTDNDFTLNLEYSVHDHLSFQSNDDKAEYNTIIVKDSEADSVHDMDDHHDKNTVTCNLDKNIVTVNEDKTTVSGNEDNIELNSRLVTHTCHSDIGTYVKESGGTDSEATFTNDGKNVIEDDGELPLYVANSSDRNCNENHDGSSQIPFFDHIDDETDYSDTDFHTRRQNIVSLIPNFDLLQFDDIEAAGSSVNEDFDVVELLKETRNDLERRNGDLGLTVFPHEPNFGTKRANVGVKSRSAKKRKKQQLKLKNTQVPDRNNGNNRRKFAESFQELQSTRMEFHDYNIDSKLTCPVCLEMYHMPSICNPCCHVFCDPCLRKMTSQGYEGIPCPLCRTVISSCQLDKDFDEELLLEYPDIYTARAMSERKTKFRHYRLPYTAPVPLGERLMRQLIASRNIQSDTRWMSHDWFKFLLGCTVGMCISLLIMLFNRVKSVRDARDVNIAFLSVLVGMSVTFLIFKHIKI